MRSASSRVRIASGSALAVAALAWMLPSLGARPTPAPPSMAGGARADEEPAPPAFTSRAPITPEAAAVWIALNKKVPFKFAQETPFEDFIAYVKKATADKDNPEGVMIYVDPVGLQEADRTMSVPVTLDLGNIRLAKGLQLVLDQLELTYIVDPEGLISITSKTSSVRPMDSAELILDRLDALQKEVSSLRVRIEHRDGVTSGPNPRAQGGQTVR